MAAAPWADDLAKLRADVLRQSAPASIQQEVTKFGRWKRILESDASMGQLLHGPQHIDSVDIYDGAVVASKLEAALILGTSIIAGAANPAARLELSATGLKAYGTVSGVPNTNTLNIENDGDFQFGVSPNQVTFVASTGVLSVPAAVITSLTIAAVGAGVIPAAYDTASANPKVRLSPSGIEMWNSGGTKTLFLDGSNGNFTLSNDPAGSSRMNITPGSISIMRGGVQQFLLSGAGAANSVDMLLTGGGAGQYVGMNAVDGLWLGASTFAGASTKFRVNPAGDMVAASATITGAVTATSGSLSLLDVSGALTITGSGVFRSGPTSGARVELDSSGLYQYGASGTGTPRARLLATGAGALGINATYTSGVINWDTAGALSLAGFTVTSSLLSSGSGGSFVTMSSGSTAFSAGGATPASAPFRVTNAGAVTMTSLTATGATITGAITASSLTITGAASFSGGSLTLPSGGTLTSSTLDMNSGTMSGLTIDGTLTMASGGKILLSSAGRIEDADGSYWDQDGLLLLSPSSLGDNIRFQYSSWGANRPYSALESFGTTSIASIGHYAYYGNGTSTSVEAYGSADAQSGVGTARLSAGAIADPSTYSSLTVQRDTSSSSSRVSALVHGRDVMRLEYTDYRATFGGYIYPGAAAGSYQTSRHISDLNSRLTLTGQVELASATVGGSAGSWAAFSVANTPNGSAGRVTVYINGVLCYIPFYAA